MGHPLFYLEDEINMLQLKPRVFENMSVLIVNVMIIN